MKYIVIKQANPYLTNKGNNKDSVGCMNDYHSVNIVLCSKNEKPIRKYNFLAS